MQTSIKKWGNSQGIIIPKEILKTAGIKLSDVLDLTAADGYITISLPFRHKTLEERISESGGSLDIDGEFDWGEPVGREIL